MATIEAHSDVRGARRVVDAEDFRDHLSTSDRAGKRKWLYPRKPHGWYYRARTWVSYLLLLILFAGPFVRINGNPLLLLNIVDRKFVVLGQVFWPQDAAIFAIAMLFFLTGIAVFTAAFGRLWCGWACPQTLLMEMVFRKIEYWIDGDADRQRALARSGRTFGKVVRRLLKHGLFLGLSFLIGNTLLSYVIGTEAMLEIVTDNPLRHLRGLAFMILFTLVFYAIFARFREQACTFICPYGRFQSTLIDEHSIVVAYDFKRGEDRGRWRRHQSPEDRRSHGLGDCVDCLQCVSVCPTGIDIRNGTQMECVHCTACIDACDEVMKRLHRPPGLIRYASLNGIVEGEKLKWTPRLVGYSMVLLALAAALTFLLFTRSDVETTLLRAPGALYQTMPDGQLSNLYLLKVLNKTAQPIPLELRLENVPGAIAIMGGKPLLPPQELWESSVLIELPRESLATHKTELEVGVYSQGQLLEKIETVFIGPRGASAGP